MNRFNFFIFVTALLIGKIYGDGFPICTSMLYDSTNRPDIQGMLMNCSNNIQAALLPPSTFSPDGVTYTPTVVNVTLTLNTLITVDDLSTQVTVDCWLRQYWQDPRINLPEEFWSSMNPAVYREGIEISPYIRDATPLNFWLPDTYIIEAVDFSPVSELIHLFPTGYLFWSRHIQLTLIEANMDLHDYPQDTQQWTVTLQSFAYSTDYMLLAYQPAGPLVLTKDVSGEYYVSLNQIWTYDSYTAVIANAPSGIFFDENREYSTILLTLNFTRQSFGIVFRLALPITIFLFIVGFSFWAEEDKRIDITITMLLVISALYLVIGQVIPFVGYYTTLDMYITTAFMVLALTCGIHFIVLQMNRKKDKYPLLEIAQSSIVYFFRLIWLPMSVLIFILFFSLSQSYIIIPFIFVSVACFINAVYHYPALRKTYITAVNKLLEKTETKEEMSTFEGIILGREEKKEVELSTMQSNAELNAIVRETYQNRITENLPSSSKGEETFSPLTDPVRTSFSNRSRSIHDYELDSDDEHD